MAGAWQSPLGRGWSPREPRAHCVSLQRCPQRTRDEVLLRGGGGRSRRSLRILRVASDVLPGSHSGSAPRKGFWASSGSQRILRLLMII